jgi:hypothetical protein
VGASDRFGISAQSDDGSLIVKIKVSHTDDKEVGIAVKGRVGSVELFEKARVSKVAFCCFLLFSDGEELGSMKETEVERKERVGLNLLKVQ